MSDDVLRDLARRAGIAVEWQDYAGRPHVVSRAGSAPRAGRPRSSRRYRSRTVGQPPPAEQAEQPGRPAALVTAVAGRPTRLDVGGNERRPAELLLERAERAQIALLPARGRLRIPAIAEIGYHRLRVEDREIVLAVSPADAARSRTWFPMHGSGVCRRSLWAEPSRGCRHRRSGGRRGTGAGRPAARARMRSPSARCTRSMPPIRSDFGPYSPSSRLFLNPLHAAPELVFGRAAYAAAVAQCPGPNRGCPNGLIDWPAASVAKYAVLRKLFEAFLDGADWDGPLGADFAPVSRGPGPLLFEHACFEALHAARMPKREWRRWPADLRDPRGAAVAFFAESQPEEILFHQFLQWITDRSVGETQAPRAGRHAHRPDRRPRGRHGP